MKRAKKIIRKLDPAEESSDGSDFDEEPPQPIKKGKGNKATKMPTLPSDPSDSDEAPLPATKKAKAKGKKTKTPKPEESNSENKPKQGIKNVKGKGKKPIKLPVPVEESSHSSDSDEAPPPNKTKGKGKGKQTKIKKKVEDSSQNSDSEEKPSPLKKGKGKKVLKKTKSAEESSDKSGSSKKPTQMKKKVKEKKSIRTESVKEPSDDTDSAEKQKQTKKKVKRKKLIKTEPMEETSDDSDSDEKQTKIKKRVKVKKATKTEPVEETSDDSDSDEKLQTSKYVTGKGKKANKKPEPVEGGSDSSEYEPEPEFDDFKHQEKLHLLSRVDGDFYDFLNAHKDDLQEFDDHENALDEQDNDYDDEKENDHDDEKVHLPGDLHGDSDESDFEADDAKPIKGKVTLKMVKEWEAELQKDGKMKLGTFTHVVKLFSAAVSRATSEDGTTDSEYSVAGSSVFNAVLNMCVVYLPNAIKKYLGTEQSGKDPQKCKHFVKIKATLVQYLTDLLKLLSAVTSDNILITMLKHLHQMSKYVACFTRISKQSIKKLLPLWCTGDETVRVLAFMCILRITRNKQRDLLQPVLKAMFMTYVKNCKFVSPSTWPGINFMRRSLVEMFSLDLDVSYPLVFLYVRQLGIHLRNAVVVPKLEHRQAVHNWQYLNSLHLWAEVVTQNIHHADMKSLHFPLAMIVSNTVKLGPTPQFYPMRFFLIEMLMNMRAADRQFLPIMPLFLDILTKFDLNKKPTKVSMKPMDFSCTIRLSKSQMNESSFRDAVVERLYSVLLEYTASISYNLSYPDVCVILILYFEEMVEKCTVSHYKKKLKQLLDKIVESSDNIYRARREYTVNYVELKSIKAWERRVQAEGTPLTKFYENWSKLNKIQKRKNVTKNDELAGAMPLIKRPKISEDAQDTVKLDMSIPVTLFPSDSEDDTDLFKNEEAPPKQKKIKNKELPKKNNKQKAEVDDADVADAEDIVQEFSAKDW